VEFWGIAAWCLGITGVCASACDGCIHSKEPWSLSVYGMFLDVAIHENTDGRQKEWNEIMSKDALLECLLKMFALAAGEFSVKIRYLEYI
jgi:hypothetical protein